MRRLLLAFIVIAVTACGGSRYGGPTLSSLKEKEVAPIQQQAVDASAEEAIDAYRILVDLPDDNPLRPRALHRLADLLLDYGETRESEQIDNNAVIDVEEYGEAITFYEELLRSYPDYAATDLVLYQLARAHTKRGEMEQTELLLNRLVSEYPQSRHVGEAHFRLAELNFLNADYQKAQRHYGALVELGEATSYYEHSLLKYSWTLFKRERSKSALESFFALIELKLAGVGFDEISGEPLALSMADTEVINDTLRGMTLIFARDMSIEQLNKYVGFYGQPRYAHLLYQRLAGLYHKEERYSEEAGVYRAFIENYPDADYAAVFQLRLVDSYRFAQDYGRVTEAKEVFLRNYWHPETGLPGSAVYQEHLTTFAREYLNDLSEYYHARYQKHDQESDYSAAVHWYQRYLSDFRDQPNAIEKHFLLAELLYEHGEYRAAGDEYEQVAYFYPIHDRAAEAGYSAILAYQELMREAERESAALRALQRESALRFISTFPRDERVPNIVLALADDDFERGDMANAKVLVELLLNGKQQLNSEDAYAAWMLAGHIAHASEDFASAEQAFQTARNQAQGQPQQVSEAGKWQALSIYKQAELLLVQQDKRAAVELLLRIPSVSPGSKVAAQARYDAAAELIALEDWSRAVTQLELFQRNYPHHELQVEVPTKLAYVYMKLGRTAEAAQAYEQIATVTDEPELQQEALWQAAELYLESGNLERAALSYKRYLHEYPGNDYRAFQVRSQLANVYAEQRQFDSRDHWLREIINHAPQAAAADSDAVQLMAARSSFTLAEDEFQAFESIELVEPLRENLARKKQKMQEALEIYRQTADYGYAEYTTAATHRIGEAYIKLSSALLESERPANLDDEELAQYELMLEEQVYPFEDKAIDILQTNADRIDEGIYNEWIKKSLAALAKLLPLQYAKQERNSEVIHALH